MAKKQFKAESKRLLDLMINSIYTHKEIFLRELISNASDAIDKLYYHSLTEGDTGISRDDFSIRIEADTENRTLKIIDNGMGMTREELEKNLGTIAKSGSLDFKSEMDNKDEIDIIGQFGVGFYSAFMVSDRVSVLSRAYGEEQAYLWESSGADGYTITEAEKDGNGTEITLKLKEDTDDERYSEYLDTYKIKGLVTKYSDYIRYPIQMMVEKHRIKPGDEEKKPEDQEYETYSELETLNSMVPLWKKTKSEITEEDYNNFYKDKFYDYTDPAKVIHTDVEGVVSYTALLFIPGKAPYNYYTKDFEKGLQLYSSGVLIMDKCPDLLPDYFSFVKGLVDSQDLSLNISRAVSYTHLDVYKRQQLSGGQQQRVAIARARAAKPAILLCDEPTGNLDSKTSQDVLGLLRISGRKYAQTIVMITHNEEIAQLADRVIRIEDGRIVTG